MRRLFLFVLTGAALLVLSISTRAQLNRRHFYGEDKFARPIELTNAILSGLNRDPNFSQCYEYSKDRTEITLIDSNGDGRPEILVKVPCGNSATSFLFWLLSRKKNSYYPIFSVGTMGIDFQRRRHRGYRDILAVGCTGNTCFFEYFAFNGRRYIRTRHWDRLSK